MSLGKNEVTEEGINIGFDLLIDLVWTLYNMAFESGVVRDDLRNFVTSFVVKEEKTEFRTIGVLVLVNEVGKNVGLLVNEVVIMNSEVLE